MCTYVWRSSKLWGVLGEFKENKVLLRYHQTRQITVVVSQHLLVDAINNLNLYVCSEKIWQAQLQNLIKWFSVYNHLLKDACLLLKTYRIQTCHNSRQMEHLRILFALYCKCNLKKIRLKDAGKFYVISCLLTF